MTYPEPVGGWRPHQCEICGYVNESVARYFGHIRGHRTGRLAAAVDPGLALKTPGYPRVRAAAPLEIMRSAYSLKPNAGRNRGGYVSPDGVGGDPPENSAGDDE